MEKQPLPQIVESTGEADNDLFAEALTLIKHSKLLINSAQLDIDELLGITDN